MNAGAPTLHSKTKWLHRVGIWFGDWWSRCLLAVGTVILAVPTFFPSIAASAWRWAWLAGAILCLSASAWGEFKRSKSIHRLEVAVEKSDRRAQLIERGLRRRLKISLGDLMKESALDQTTYKGKLKSRTRATVYCHDKARRVFIPLARYSGNPLLEAGGRDDYPDDQGFIAEAWADPWSYKKDLPEDFEEWVAALVTEDEIPEEVARNLTMHSRSLAGARIYGGGAVGENAEKIGIVIVESLEARGLKSTTGQKLPDANWFKVVDALVKTYHLSLTPHFDAV